MASSGNSGRTPSDSRPARPLIKKDQRLWDALRRVIVTLPRALEADMEAASSLSISEHTVLVYLSEAPGNMMRMIELAASSCLTQSGTTRVVDRLVKEGLVARRRDPEDMRGQVAALTDRGLERLRDAHPGHVTAVRRRILDHLTGIDLAAMAEGLERIADNATSSVTAHRPDR